MAAFAVSSALGQQSEPSHDTSQGGAAAANPGGTTSAERGQAESRGQEHAEAAAKHGEGHEEEPMPHETLWKWANFAILAGGLGWLISKNAGPYFRSRSEEIRHGIEEAAKTRADAEARAAEIERRLSNLAVDVEQIRSQSREEIAREGERIRAETEAQIRKIQAQAENEIQSATKRATHELKAFSARLAIESAEGQIRNRLTGPAQDELANGFIAELNGKAVTH